MMTTILSVLLVVSFGAYLVRRRARLRSEEENF
jgi:hypothetical protein